MEPVKMTTQSATSLIKSNKQNSSNMALDNYFAQLKLNTGASNIAIVQDNSVRPHPSIKKDRQELLSLEMRQLSESRWMDCSSRSDSSGKFDTAECDEPLHLPTRRQSLSQPPEELNAFGDE